MSIYGEGNVRSPHFMSAEMTPFELWKLYPRMCTPRDFAQLTAEGLIRYDETLGKYVLVPPKVDAPAPPPAPKRRGKKR